MRLGIALLSARRNVPRIREAFSHAIAIFEELESQRGVAGVLLNRGVFNAEICDFAAAARDLEAALQGFDAVKDNRGKAIALFNLAEIYAVMGDPRRGREVGEAGLAIARDAGQRVMEAVALANLAFVAASAGDLDRAIRLGSEALALHRETESPQWTGRLLGDLAEWSARIGDLPRARSYVEEMFAYGASVSAEWPQRFYWSAAQVLHECGEHELAARELERAHKLVTGLAAELEGEDLTRYELVAWNRAISAAYERDEWPHL
jgi:tetratricopeptide (TPR) repeat protein